MKNLFLVIISLFALLTLSSCHRVHTTYLYYEYTTEFNENGLMAMKIEKKEGDSSRGFLYFDPNLGYDYLDDVFGFYSKYNVEAFKLLRLRLDVEGLDISVEKSGDEIETKWILHESRDEDFPYYFYANFRQIIHTQDLQDAYRERYGKKISNTGLFRKFKKATMLVMTFDFNYTIDGVEYTGQVSYAKSPVTSVSYLIGSVDDLYHLYLDPWNPDLKK